MFIAGSSWAHYMKAHLFDEEELMSHQQFFSYTDEIVSVIHRLEHLLSDEQVDWLQQKQGFALAGDGSWAVRRNSNQGCYTFEV